MHKDSGLIALFGKTFWDHLSDANKAKMRKMYRKRLANAQEYSQFKTRAQA